jgi:hypothetical protein
VRKGGFSRDDGASARKAFDGMRKEMEEVNILGESGAKWLGWQESCEGGAES